MEVSRHLGGMTGMLTPVPKERKMRVFDEMSDMIVDTEHSRIRSNLFVLNNILCDQRRVVGAAFTFIAKMGRIIFPP